MEKEEKTERLLQDVLERLDILVAGRVQELRKILNNQYLTTKKRKVMYNMFDGKTSMQEIAKKLGVTFEAVRRLKVALEQDRLIKIKKEGKTEYPQKLIE